MSDLHRFTDDFRPARGCANGLALSGAIWVVLVILALALMVARGYADGIRP